MISRLAPLPGTADRRASRTLSIPDAPAVARAKAAAHKRSAATAATSPAPRSAASPTAARYAAVRASAAPAAGTARRGASWGGGAASEGEGEDADMRRARMLLRGFDARRKLAGEGGGVEVLGEARRLVEGVEERFEARTKTVRFM